MAKANKVSLASLDTMELEQVALKNVAWTFPTYDEGLEKWNLYGGEIVRNHGRGEGDYGAIDKGLAESLAEGWQSRHPADIIPASKTEIDTVTKAREAYLGDERNPVEDKEACKVLWGEVTHIGISGYRRNQHLVTAVKWSKENGHKWDKNYKLWAKLHKRTVLDNPLALIMIQLAENAPDDFRRTPSDAARLKAAKVLFDSGYTQKELKEVIGTVGQRIWNALAIDKAIPRLKLFERWTMEEVANKPRAEQVKAGYLKFSATRIGPIGELLRRIEGKHKKEDKAGFPTDAEILADCGQIVEGPKFTTESKLKDLDSVKANLPKNVQRVLANLENKNDDGKSNRQVLATLAQRESAVSDRLASLPKIVAEVFLFLTGEGEYDLTKTLEKWTEHKAKLDKVY